MITKTVIPPSLLTTAPKDETAQKLYYAVSIDMLKKIHDACLIIIPAPYGNPNSYYSIIEKWPIKYKQKALEILAQLHRKNRIVDTNLFFTRSSLCTDDNCKAYVGLFLSDPECFMIAKDECVDCINKQQTTDNLIDFYEYLGTKVNELIYENTELHIENGGMDQNRLEKIAFAPILKYAKVIKILDRYIGRSIFDYQKKC